VDYWQAVAEYDYINWQINKMLEDERSRSVLARMIDESTGFDAQKRSEAQSLMRRARRLRRVLEAGG
jgi:hypothetical protein